MLGKSIGETLVMNHSGALARADVRSGCAEKIGNGAEISVPGNTSSISVGLLDCSMASGVETEQMEDEWKKTEFY